jgi:rhomboid protease GluP
MHPEPIQPPDPGLSLIPARTERQAMDWSLVLASQGIEPVIERLDDGGWALIVPRAQRPAAVEAIRRYQLENRHWPWQQPLPKSRAVFDWGGAAWVVLTMVFYWLSETTELRGPGSMSGAALSQGEWWRLFTATLLHGDLAHLTTNAVFGFLMLGLALGRYGTGVGLLAALLAGAGGNLAAWWVHGEMHRSLGASGVVMGALGLVAAQSVPLLRPHRHAVRLALGGLAAGVMLFVFLGLNPRTDVMAHFGGFASGLMLGALLSFWPNLARVTVPNLLAGLIFTTLVIYTWALALQPGG